MCVIIEDFCMKHLFALNDVDAAGGRKKDAQAQRTQGEEETTRKANENEGFSALDDRRRNWTDEG